MAKLDHLVGVFNVFPMFHNEAEVHTTEGKYIRDALFNLRTSGQLGAAGLSTYELSNFRKAAQEYFPIQVNTNVLHSNLDELISLDHDLGEGHIHMRSLFLQGLLLRHSSGLAPAFREFLPVLESFWKWVDNLGISDLEGALSVVNLMPNSYFVLGLASPGQLTEALHSLKSSHIPMEGPNVVAPANMSDPRKWPGK